MEGVWYRNIKKNYVKGCTSGGFSRENTVRKVSTKSISDRKFSVGYVSNGPTYRRGREMQGNALF